MKVDSANKRGSLLEVVQVLTDLNLIISRAYISSDGGWFMDGEFFLIHFHILIYENLMIFGNKFNFLVYGW